MRVPFNQAGKSFEIFCESFYKKGSLNDLLPSDVYKRAFDN